MTNEELLSVAEIVDRLVTRFHKQAADHEAKMVEYRAAFGARTEADAKIIAGLREESAKHKAERDDLYQREGIEQKRHMDVEDERDGLLTQVRDMRAELRAERDRMPANLTQAEAEYRVECDAIRAEVTELRVERDSLQAKIVALKSQTSKHPVKVGEHVAWCGSGFLTGTIKQVAEVRSDRAYRFTDDDVWSFALCEPCDPPATHDTEAGKAAAEAAVKTEPVAEEIKVGDVVRPKVWGIGQMTKVTQVLPDGTLLIENSIKTWKVDEVVKLVRKCVGADEAWTEVRKVTT